MKEEKGRRQNDCPETRDIFLDPFNRETIQWGERERVAIHAEHRRQTHLPPRRHTLCKRAALTCLWYVSLSLSRSSILVIIRYIFCCLCVRAVNISAPLLLLFRRTRLFPQSLCRPVNRLCPVTVTVWHGNKLHFLSISRTRQGCKRKGRLKRDGITKVNCRYYLVNCILG